MRKPAARVGDMHTCPLSDGTKPHVGGPIQPSGNPKVLIGGQPAAVAGNTCTCVSPAPDIIQQGSMTVKINQQPAARQGDPTAHGGIISSGLSTVLIGD